MFVREPKTGCAQDFLYVEVEVALAPTGDLNHTPHSGLPLPSLGSSGLAQGTARSTRTASDPQQTPLPGLQESGPLPQVGGSEAHRI